MTNSARATLDEFQEFAAASEKNGVNGQGKVESPPELDNVQINWALMLKDG